MEFHIYVWDGVYYDITKRYIITGYTESIVCELFILAEQKTQTATETET